MPFPPKKKGGKGKGGIPPALAGLLGAVPPTATAGRLPGPGMAPPEAAAVPVGPMPPAAAPSLAAPPIKKGSRFGR